MNRPKKINPALLKAYKKIQEEQKDSASFLSAKKLVTVFFRKNGLSQEITRRKLQKIWRELMGESTANLTKAIFLKQNTLYIQIDSCVQRTELYHRKEKILHQIQCKMDNTCGKKITKILFI